MVRISITGKASLTLPADDQILIVREFAAPRHLVYRAWTTPELVKRWWMGERGTMTSVEMDLRVGGRWRHVALVRGEYEIAFHGEYREIVPNEKIVYTEVYEQAEDPSGSVLNTVTFTENNGRTTLTLHTETGSREIRDLIINSGMESGMQEQMDALEAIAANLPD